MRQYKAAIAPHMTIIEIPKQEIQKIDFALCQQPRESLESFYNRQINKPQILINGGFFNMSNGDTVFNFIDERETISDTSNYQWGMGVVNNDLVYGNLQKITGIRDFVSGYPNLIDNGVICPITFGQEINYVARRTAIGYNEDTIFVFIVDEPGIKLEPFQEIIASTGAKYVINLDGGGSTRLLVEGKLQSDNLWSRPVDNVVAFYLQEAPQTLYRCQCGAFNIKANADKMCKTIQEFDDTIGAGYRNAYVRYIDGMYKVQVAAMSKREGAEKILADLQTKGIKGFITVK